MTTKKFQVSTNLKCFKGLTFTCDKREDAIAYITDTLLGNSQINPQDLILEEVEVNKTELLVKELIAKLRSYGDEWIVTQEENRAIIWRTCTFWSSAVLMDIVEFMNQPEYADHNFYIDGEGRFVIYNMSEANYKHLTKE